jgi:hypothetical protein
MNPLLWSEIIKTLAPLNQLETSKANLCTGYDISQFLQAALLAALSGRHFQIVPGRS